MRHGQSEGNVAYSKSVHGDSSMYSGKFLDRHSSLWRLTDRGRGEAVEAGAWLRERCAPFDAFYTSEFLRAMETAALLDMDGAQWHTETNCRERDWGALDLLPKGGDGPAPARAERRPSNRYGEGRRDRSRGGVPAEGSWTKRNQGRAFERTRLFVSALDPGTRWQELKDHFRDGGFDVIYASVSTDRYTGESKGCGIVQLATEAEAERAIGAMDRSELDGATIFCREDRQNRDRRTGDNSGTRLSLIHI